MRFLLTILTALFAACAVAADDYPNRPITIVVPYTAGGGVDTVTRILAPLLSQRLGQPILIENRAGVSGMVGSQMVARAKPDGYTLLAGNTTTNVSNLFVYKQLPYDPRKDFTPIVMVDRGPCVLVVPPDSKFNSVQDIIKELKSQPPDTLTYGTSGNGSFHHMSASLFESLTHTHMRQIAYKGSPNVMTDLMGKRLDMAFEVIPVAEPLIKSGRLKALAVTSKTEMAALPGVKPVADQGLPGFEMVAWKGIFAPAGTPDAIAEKLGRELSAIVQMPDVRKRLESLGVIADGRRNAEFGKTVQADIAYWGPILRDAGVVPE
jgi:tripartite-type tricarboxylate transporter receptor subunit TctC